MQGKFGYSRLSIADQVRDGIRINANAVPRGKGVYMTIWGYA